MPAAAVEDEGSGWGFLLWLIPALLVAAAALFAFLRWRLVRPEPVIVEKIEPYRAPPSAAPPPTPTPSPAPAPAPDTGGYVTSSIPTRTSAASSPANRPASVPNDGGVYARPIRRF